MNVTGCDIGRLVARLLLLLMVGVKLLVILVGQCMHTTCRGTSYLWQVHLKELVGTRLVGRQMC